MLPCWFGGSFSTINSALIKFVPRFPSNLHLLPLYPTDFTMFESGLFCLFVSIWSSSVLSIEIFLIFICIHFFILPVYVVGISTSFSRFTRKHKPVRCLAELEGVGVYNSVTLATRVRISILRASLFYSFFWS